MSRIRLGRCHVVCRHQSLQSWWSGFRHSMSACHLVARCSKGSIQHPWDLLLLIPESLSYVPLVVVLFRRILAGSFLIQYKDPSCCLCVIHRAFDFPRLVVPLDVAPKSLCNLIAILWFARDGFPYFKLIKQLVVFAVVVNTLLGFVSSDAQCAHVYFFGYAFWKWAFPSKSCSDYVIHNLLTGVARSHLLPRCRMDRTHCWQLCRCTLRGTPSIQNSRRTVFNAWTFIKISFLLSRTQL